MFLDPGDLNFDFREKLSECFCSAFPSLPNAVFPFFSNMRSFRDVGGGGGGNQPPPGVGVRPKPPGARVKGRATILIPLCLSR